MQRKKEKNVWKVWLFLLVQIAGIGLYCTLLSASQPEIRADQYPIYTQCLMGIFYLLVCIGSFGVIKPKKLQKRDWLTAFCLGLVSVGITIPIQPTGIINGVATALAYLSIQEFLGQEGYFYLVHPEKKERIKNIEIVAGGFLVLLLLRYLTVAKTGNPVRWDIGFDVILKGAAAGISEELVFRMFLFAVVTKLAKGEPPFALSVLVMTLPFAMFHAVEPWVYQNIAKAVQIIVSVFINALILVWVNRKRDCVTAILLHAGWDIIVAMITS